MQSFGEFKFKVSCTYKLLWWMDGQGENNDFRRRERHKYSTNIIHLLCCYCLYLSQNLFFLLWNNSFLQQNEIYQSNSQFWL